MSWLIGIALRPLGALVLFGGASFLAYLIRPLIPSAWRGLLYDRELRKRHPWKFAIGAMAAIYGTVAVVCWMVTS